MQEHGIVAQVNASIGRLALRVADGSYVLAEQLDTQPLRTGQELSGEMAVVGMETFTDRQSAARYGVFVVAYGLSREAVEQELR
ncbi:hypothetical protein [Massilia sp. BJB1822]|uniref:hypothetical protein n=1 Tax=Massilia sp. BJB1822 TaxID=2744470 RepID=UPI0015949CC0|nr:hypothetical protein [Massilia sp. BJB1822]NVD97673.1 hypothetical protein [Massilia sp. BJB1822]